MKKLYSLLFAMLAFAGMASAQVTFTAGTDKTDDASVFTLAKDGVTITISNGNLSTAEYRVFKGETLTISSETAITGVKFTSTTKAGSDKYGPDCLSGEGYTFEEGGKTGAWTGSATQVVLTATKGQCRLKEIVVYFDGEEPGGGGEEPTPSIDWTSSLEAPLTVAQAIEKASQLGGGEQSDVKVYVKGIISRITEIDTQNAQGVPYGNATYYISDDGQEANELYVFRGKGLNGNNVTSADIKVGDEVVILGYIQNYVKGETSTLEFTQNNELAAINGQGAPDVEVKVYTKIADVKAEVTADKVKADFQATDLLVTYVNGKSVYVYDGTDGLLFYADDAKLAEGIKAGDKITAKFSGGQLYLYNGLTEMTFAAIEDLTVNSSDNAVEPQKVTVADVGNNPKDYENELVQFEELTAQAEALESRNIKFMDDSDNELTVRDNWNVLTTTQFNTEASYTVTGFVALYNGAVQIYPRTAEDVDSGEEPVPYELEGEGTLEKPYTVADVQYLINQEDRPTEAVWVTGYIMGAAKSTMNNVVKEQSEDLQATNIVLAEDANEESNAKMIPVQLSANKDQSKDIRSQINLVDHFDYLGKQIWVLGKIEKYFSVAGVKDVTDYSLDGESTGVNAVADDAKADGRIYNIAGQRVSAVGKGLYIVGTKKVLSE